MERIGSEIEYYQKIESAVLELKEKEKLKIE